MVVAGYRYCSSSSPPVIGTSFLPHNSVCIREVSFGEKEHKCIYGTVEPQTTRKIAKNWS